jgi:hypothetical protein
MDMDELTTVTDVCATVRRRPNDLLRALDYMHKDPGSRLHIVPTLGPMQMISGYVRDRSVIDPVGCPENSVFCSEMSSDGHFKFQHACSCLAPDNTLLCLSKCRLLYNFKNGDWHRHNNSNCFIDCLSGRTNYELAGVHMETSYDNTAVVFMEALPGVRLAFSSLTLITGAQQVLGTVHLDQEVTTHMDVNDFKCADNGYYFVAVKRSIIICTTNHIIRTIYTSCNIINIIFIDICANDGTATFQYYGRGTQENCIQTITTVINTPALNNQYSLRHLGVDKSYFCFVRLPIASSEVYAARDFHNILFLDQHGQTVLRRNATLFHRLYATSDGKTLIGLHLQSLCVI